MSAPTYEIFDDRFTACIRRDAKPDVLWSGGRWCEGPAYFPAGRYLIWSDIPNDRLMRWDECSGAVSVFRHPANYPNGNTVDRQGRLITAEHGRRVTRTEIDGRITVLAERYEGKRLNSPNDVVVKSDGSIWFTDPPYGILSDYQGHKGESELGKNCIFRIDGKTGELSIACDDCDRPNGLAFSLDEKQLYVADSGLSARNMKVYDVGEDGKLTNGRIFASCAAGRFDGFRLDEAGRLWSATEDGVHCHDPDGTLIGKINFPEPLSNVVFGGPKRNWLFVTGATSVYCVWLTVNGAKTF
ncbi:MAG: SMP-30/gluconolactonase/LRE family protein [Variibacter sp.]|nr:SMP-30/gluconolactonase/LRE family protein [Variibacter sp.]